MKRIQKGLSLVELLVAMALGLLITAAVVQLFITNRQTFNLQQGTASVLEQGQFAVDFLSKEMMSAGFGEVDRVFAIDGASDGAQYDTVRYFLEDGADCSGADIDEDDTFANDPWKQYSVTEQNGTGVLICTDSDGTENHLIDNVEAFQVLYGVSIQPASGDRRFYYASANQINTRGIPQNNIVSIRYAILIASDGVTNSISEVIGQNGDDPVALQMLDQSFPYSSDQAGYLVDFEDRRLRRLFVSTVTLRNVAGG